jgi:hypothetical protein
MEIVHSVAPIWKMWTVTASPGVTVQLASPEHPVNGVSAFGRSSNQASYCSPTTGSEGTDDSATPAWMRSAESYPPIPVQVAAKPGGKRPPVGTANVEVTEVIPPPAGVTA